MQFVIAVLLLVVSIFGIPWIMYRSLIWARNRDRSGQRALGSVLQELDRHTARPSTELRLKHESEVVNCGMIMAVNDRLVAKRQLSFLALVHIDAAPAANVV